MHTFNYSLMVQNTCNAVDQHQDGSFPDIREREFEDEILQKGMTI